MRSPSAQAAVPLLTLAGYGPRRLVQPGTNRGQTGGKGIIPKDGRDGERRRVGGRAAGTSSAAAASPESATG
jgi:hypothetical protein